MSLSTLLNAGAVARTRRNHALEHATLSVLGQKVPHILMGGYSDPLGFWILGRISADDLQDAIDEAQCRLRGGEAGLAIHPNCGTNFAVLGVLAGVAAWLAMLGSGPRTRDRLERLPLAISAAALALVLGQPIGPLLQARLTTDAQIGDLRVVEVRCFQRGDMPVYRVITRH